MTPPSDAGGIAASCRRGTLQLTLASSVPTDPELSRLDPSVELPFSPEPGVGLGVGEELFATGLRHTARGAVAVLARFGSEASLDELSELHGDAAPPRLAAAGDEVFVGLQQASASGHELSVARLVSDGSPLSWRPLPHQRRDESNVFDLATTDGSRVLAVWDEGVADLQHGRVLGAVVSMDVSQPPPLSGVPLSAQGVDAEAPRLSSRPGGYWLAWLVNLGMPGSKARIYDPGRDDEPTPAPYGERALEVVPLDVEGVPMGSALRVGEGRRGLVGYDLTTAPGGAAWLVWRDSAPSPGASGGRIMMAEVRGDGTHDIAPLGAWDVGAGEPSWLSSGPASSPWLSLPDARDRTLLMRVERPFEPSAPLALDAELRGATALGAVGERVLFASPRGAAVEFFPAQCEIPGRALTLPRAEPSRSAPRDASAESQRGGDRE